MVDGEFKRAAREASQRAARAGSTLERTHAELAIGHAVSPAGHKVGLTMVDFLTRARCDTAEATQMPAALRAYLVGQAVILHCELAHTPVAPAGRKVQTRPREPQLFTAKDARSARAWVAMRRDGRTVRSGVNFGASAVAELEAREASRGVAVSTRAHGGERTGGRADLADGPAVEQITRDLTLREGRTPRSASSAVHDGT